ncbi:MAG: glycosyltransferase family 1 protein [Acidobacteriota bacterium]
MSDAPNDALRIALVTETFPPEVNGVARTLNQLVRGLAARGHVLEVVRPRQGKADVAMQLRPSPNGQPAWSELLTAGCPIPMYPGLRFGLPTLRSLGRRWDEARPDVVHIATEGPLGLVALRAARYRGIPVATTFHTNFHDYGDFYGYGGMHRLAVGYLRWFHNRTRRTLVPGPDVVERLARRGFERLDVLSRGVDSQQFRPDRRNDELRASWGAGPDDPVVVSVGRLAEEKNPELVIEGFRALRRIDQRWNCVVVGDGPAAESMRAAFPEGLFAGMRRGADLAAHYASGDLLLFPSLTETFGNVLLEGMACGLASVSFDYAAAAQLVSPGVDGYVAPRGDADAWLGEVRACAARPLDELRAVGRRAAARGAERTWERIVERFEQVLRDVAAEGEVATRRGAT